MIYNTDMSSIPADLLVLSQTLQPQQANINNAHKLILMEIIGFYFFLKQTRLCRIFAHLSHGNNNFNLKIGAVLNNTNSLKCYLAFALPLNAYRA